MLADECFYFWKMESVPAEWEWCQGYDTTGTGQLISGFFQKNTGVLKSKVTLQCSVNIRRYFSKVTLACLELAYLTLAEAAEFL